MFGLFDIFVNHGVRDVVAPNGASHGGTSIRQKSRVLHAQPSILCESERRITLAQLDIRRLEPALNVEPFRKNETVDGGCHFAQAGDGHLAEYVKIPSSREIEDGDPLVGSSQILS